MTYNAYPYPTPDQIAAGASNVKTGQNPVFTAADFFEVFDQFEGKVRQAVLDQFLAMADAAVKQVRWHESWNYATCLFIAHFLTLYLQKQAGGNCATANAVIAAAQARGLQVSKSVGDVSVGYDFSQITKDLNGWANWQSTAYGIEFASMARTLAKAGMLVW